MSQNLVEWFSFVVAGPPAEEELGAELHRPEVAESKAVALGWHNIRVPLPDREADEGRTSLLFNGAATPTADRGFRTAQGEKTPLPLSSADH